MTSLKTNADTNPSYFEVVEPLLRAHDGDATALLAAYPNFDPNPFHCYLHEACARNHLHAVRGLMQCGASLLRKDENGCTPLFLVCWCFGDECVALIAWLLSHEDARVTLNWTDGYGWTSLHAAASNGSIRVVRVLLAHGADATLKNGDGFTPTCEARSMDMKEVAELLEEAERAHAVLHLGEWRPHKQACFPRGYRAAMRTLVVLAKARTPALDDASELHSHYPSACLDLLPEELLQYLFAYVTSAHVPDVWTERERKREKSENL